MAGKNRKLLQIHHKAIVQDLDVMDILDDLLAKQAINSEDFEYIANLDKADRVYKTRYLLKLISQSSNSAYETFVDTLEENYAWLWKLLTVDSDMGSFEDSLSRGDVPRLPDHFVKRSLLEKQLLSKLRQLTRHNILALHGMSGCGKTTLAISVLRTNSELITSDFNGVVYWLNLGNCKTVDDVIAQQNKLYRKASLNTSYMNSSISMSSIGSNADSLSNYDLTWQDLKDKLKSLFAEQPLKDGLLVLDEVNEKICVEGFDIGCKILVTTRDNNVVTNFHPQIVKIENHFSEEESLSLFASCLELEEKKLPRQAKKLHEICKGSPFHIALIGAELAENKERLVHDTRRWNYYINKLEKKEFIFNFSRSDVNPMKTIEFCINSLKPDLLKLFKMLAILPDNVKLSANVLSKLWNKTTIEIETIIQQLRSKSLIIVFYDEDKHDYTYEIHDLIMGYLRTSSNEDDMKKLHGDLLTSYKYGVNNYPIQIEDDGYIALYVGYHLGHTKNLNNMWSLFHKLYLNLKFLGNKVRLTGPADVILDLQKYENYIVNDDIDKALLYNIKEYLSTHGIDLYRYPCTDIVQGILQNESKGILYMKAWEIAQDRCCQNELYFEFLHEQNVDEMRYSTIDVKEPIKSVCFLGDYVLIGTKTGMIKLFHISTNKLKKELHGTSPIHWIGACPSNLPFIAALDVNGVIRIWYVDDIQQCDGIIEEEAEEALNNNFPSNVTISLSNMPFINCRWSNHDETLITHTLHVIYVYNTNGDIKYCISESYKDIQISCCVPSNCENTVLVATNKSLDILNLKTGEKHCFDDTGGVLDIVIVPGTNKVITLKEKQVMQYEYKMLRRFNKDCSDRECKEIITSGAVKDNISFISIAVNKSGSLLFVSTNDSRVICIDLKTYVHVLDMENRRGNVVSMSVSEISWDELEAGPDVLLTGTDDAENSAKVWYLDAYATINRQRDNGKVRLTSKFDASFVNALYPPTPTPSTVTLTTDIQSTPSTPKRHQSFVNMKTKEKRNVMRATMSLDRHSLKPLNLRGITNGNVECVAQPLLAIVDDRNNVKVMRGRKLITEIQSNSDDHITKVKISPCNHYIICGLKSGIVKKTTIRTKEQKDILNVNSAVVYMNFVNSDLLMVAGKNRCLMAYMLKENGEWKPEMLERGNANLGSQEILNDIQGFKKKSSQSEIHSSESDSSISSKERLFKNCDKKNLCEASNLVDCFWIPNLGLITIKSNATIKLWDEKLNLTTVLNARQMNVCITCTAFQNNVLVICDEFSKSFQSFELKTSERAYLDLIQEYTLNFKIRSCALTDDGNILAMGLDTGDIVIWHIQNKKQLKFLRHHKSKVNFCQFSPTPDRLYRSMAQTPLTPYPYDDDQPPLVLVTMASEIVFWNITYVIRNRRRGLRAGQNVITPLASPIDIRNDSHQVQNSNTDIRSNCFFGSNPFDPKQYWKINWKRKTCKEGSKRKEILACIKLTGMSAKQMFIDEKFSCFITVDNPGHIHIMKLMGTCAS